MNELEGFARLHIEEPSPEVPATPSPAPAETASPGIWQRTLNLLRRKDAIDSSLRTQLAPAPGEAYRMIPLATLLEKLHIQAPEGGYIDDDALVSLHVKLRKLGIALATGITGPLRLRISDMVPVTDIDQPHPSRYSAVTVILYLLAWMLQADDCSARDLAIVDEWIDRNHPKEPWKETAKGTFRWLLSRKLILTYKRKQRTGRIKRYHNVLERLRQLLLQLVADPDAATPRRMQRLNTLYETLGLDAASIHSDLHRLSIGTNTYVPVNNRSMGKAHLRDTAANTRRAQALLASVFAEEDAPASTESGKSEQSPRSEQTAVGKQETAAYLALKRLAEKEEWTKDEAMTLAEEFGMTLGAMLEQVNDLAYDLVDAPVAEDEDELIYIDTETAAECFAAKN